jgi:hypothetical protein
VDAPLGEEDAAKREDVHAVFVDVRRLIPQSNLHTNEINSIKVVVGRKGSGKTHILRYIEETARETREVIFSALSDNTIPSRLESQFATNMDRPHARRRWSKFWRIIISLSVVTKFTSSRANNSMRGAAARFVYDRGLTPDRAKPSEWTVAQEQLAQYFESYLMPGSVFKFSKLRGDRDPGSLMPFMFEGIQNLRTFDDFIDYVDVVGLEADVASLAKFYKPFHVIIDGVDDVSWRQPRMWLDFQVGLFDAVFFLHEAQRSSEQINVTVAIRNFIYLAAAESPHIDRVKNLLSLNWTPESALQFLNSRLRQISTRGFEDATKLASERPLATWLGFDSIKAIRREQEEDVEGYFLRHTRLSPRNLIRLFNLLVQEKNRRALSGKPFLQSDFRGVVEKIAGEVSDLMMKTAAEEIIAFVEDISAEMPANRAEGVVLWVAEELANAIRRVGMETMGWNEYRDFLNDFHFAVMPKNTNESEYETQKNIILIESILWRSNVIAFWGERNFGPSWIFSWSPQDDLRPRAGSRVGFHSSLIRKCDLGVCQDGPVF